CARQVGLYSVMDYW
nr:immunoglobulin heavy chain junction region [Mus musculus]